LRAREDRRRLRAHLLRLRGRRDRSQAGGRRRPYGADGRRHAAPRPRHPAEAGGGRGAGRLPDRRGHGRARAPRPSRHAGAPGATVVLCEGAPDHPGPDRVWATAARHRAVVLGVSPTLVRSLKTRGDDWARRHDLSALRVLGSTGEPWNPEPYEWLARVVG